MSYEVLARRFRPQTFDDVEGQKHVVTALRNAIKLGRVPHAILLAGPRGVGKTTLARILARALNCDEGPTEKPCGRCSPCLEIAAGTSLDVQEIDAASNTGVDNVREIRESVRYAAAPGKHRIFIIDEVHMLSTAAFNALLKTLEEPPPRSLFIFATTDPQKIPQTVLSRVQRFDLRRLSNAELLALLRKICAADAIEAPEPVLRAIAREADGSGRDALTLLDRLTSALGAKLVLADAIAILDVIDRKLLLDVLEPVLARRPGDALQAMRRALEQGVDPMRFAGDLLAEIRDLVVARLVDDPTGLIDAAPDALEELRARARAHDAETLQRLFRVLSTRMQELAAGDPPGARARDGGGAARDLARSRDARARSFPSSTRWRAAAAGPRPRVPHRRAARPTRARARRRGPGRARAPRRRAVRAPRRLGRLRVPAPAPAPRSDPIPGYHAPVPAKREEPPPPDDADMAVTASEEPAPAPQASALSLDQRNALEARVRAEAKAHPRVREVQEALDAELREIRVERGGAR